MGHLSYNIAVGIYAFYGSYSHAKYPTVFNILIGHKAGYKVYNELGECTGNVGIGDRALYNLTGPCNYNTAIGTQAGYNIKDNNYCTFIGYRAGYDTFNKDYVTCIGVDAQPVSTYDTVLGCWDNTSYEPEALHFGGNLFENSASDRRLKKNIVLVKNSLEKIMLLKPVNFD